MSSSSVYMGKNSNINIFMTVSFTAPKYKNPQQ